MCVMLASGVATSQTTVNNSQVNLVGDIFADQTLNVVTVEEGVAATTTSLGNSMGATFGGIDGVVTSDQTNSHLISGHGVVNVTNALGDSSNVATSAVGNSGTVTAAYDTVSGHMIQTNTGEVIARSQIEGQTAQAGDVVETSLAAGNSQGLLLVNGSMGARVGQHNEGDVAADGGAEIRYVSGTAVVAGTAAGNNIDLTGANGSAARVISDQYNISDKVQATKFAAYGNSYLTTTAATASGNNLNAANEGTLLDVTSQQYNSAYVRAQAEASSYEFGGAQATAYGVGNSAMATNYNGPGLVLDNSQVNDGGGVEVIASFEGHDGYDAGSSATAIGNAVSGYVCNQCSGSMNVNNSQSNNVDVSARSTTTITGRARSVAGVSTATGNSATFSVTNSGY